MDANILLIVSFFVSVSLFFWSVFKAVQTQKKEYAWGMLPFLLFMFALFLI